MVASTPISVLLIEDQEVFRAAMREVISASDGFDLVAEVGSGEEGIVLAAALRPELAFVDVGLPGIDGFETTRRLRALRVPTLVVIVSTDASQQWSQRAKAAGAIAFVSKGELGSGTLRRLCWETKVLRGRSGRIGH